MHELACICGENIERYEAELIADDLVNIAFDYYEDDPKIVRQWPVYNKFNITDNWFQSRMKDIDKFKKVLDMCCQIHRGYNHLNKYLYYNMNEIISSDYQLIRNQILNDYKDNKWDVNALIIDVHV